MWTDFLDELDGKMITRNESIATIWLNAYLLQGLNSTKQITDRRPKQQQRYFKRSTMSTIFPLHTIGVTNSFSFTLWYGNADVDIIFDVDHGLMVMNR